VGTTSGKVETTVMQSQVSGALKRAVGLGEKGDEGGEKVGVASERNSSACSIPLPSAELKDFLLVPRCCHFLCYDLTLPLLFLLLPPPPITLPSLKYLIPGTASL